MENMSLSTMQAQICFFFVLDVFTAMTEDNVLNLKYKASLLFLADARILITTCTCTGLCKNSKLLK